MNSFFPQGSELLVEDRAPPNLVKQGSCLFFAVSAFGKDRVPGSLCSEIRPPGPCV